MKRLFAVATIALLLAGPVAQANGGHKKDCKKCTKKECTQKQCPTGCPKGTCPKS